MRFSSMALRTAASIWVWLREGAPSPAAAGIGTGGGAARFSSGSEVAAGWSNSGATNAGAAAALVWMAAIRSSWLATSVASCFTSEPSSPISLTTDWMRSAPAELADTTRPSTAASLRPNSATWRARSAVPRERSAIWLPTSVRSRSRIETAL